MSVGDAGAAAGAAAPCDSGRILIVDDEEDIARLFQVILEGAIPDCEIDLAANGKEAVARFCDDHHAVILMDLHR